MKVSECRYSVIPTDSNASFFLGIPSLKAARKMRQDHRYEIRPRPLRIILQTMSSSPTNRNGATLSATAAGEARFFANAVASWYLATLDPYAPHTQNVESRLRHPVHVVTRRILYGNVHAAQAGGRMQGEDDLEAVFNDDDAEFKDGGPETLTRRSAARMEAFLASCSVALREVEDIENITPKERQTSGKIAGAVGKEGAKSMSDKEALIEQKKEAMSTLSSNISRSISSSSSKAPRIFRQIDHGDLILRLELYCRT